MATTPTNIFKIAFVGDAGSGKSTYLRAIVAKGQKKPIWSHPNHIPTLGVDVMPIRMLCSDQSVVEFDVWDTGDCHYKSMFDLYLLQANAIVYFIDGTKTVEEKKASFRHWKDQVDKVCPNVPYIVIYTKFDLKSGVALGTSGHASTIYEVSSKRGDNLQLPLKSLVKKLTKTDVNSFLI
jgi:small GTP-binding protein